MTSLMPRVGGELIGAEDLKRCLRLDLNHTEVKKGRGNPKITKLRETITAYLPTIY